MAAKNKKFKMISNIEVSAGVRGVFFILASSAPIIDFKMMKTS
jgi:hypothetical protein